MVFSDIIQILSVLASFGVIAMTYHVYVLNHRHNQIDNYLKQITNLYYKIEDDWKILKTIKRNPLNNDVLNQYYRQIESNATLLSYYIRNFPCKYEGKEKFTNLIDSISHSPEELGDYEVLSDEFKKFFKNIED